MKSANGGSKNRRITDAIVQAIIGEIRAHKDGKREGKLSWAALEEFSGFSRVALWTKPQIKEPFQAAKASFKADATPKIKPRKTIDERIVALEASLDELRETVRQYDERWALYEYNAHQLGIDPALLRRPLDPVARGQVRSRKRNFRR